MPNQNQIMTMLFSIACLMGQVLSLQAQHCAPILDSYLSRITLEATDDQDVWSLEWEYCKHGGRKMPGYQAYLIGYMAADRARMIESLRTHVFDPKGVHVIDTMVVRPNEKGRYVYTTQLSVRKFKQQIELWTKDRSSEDPRLAETESSFELLVFIPFVENRKYAYLEGIAEDRHECNYTHAPALLIQTLPYQWRLRNFDSGKTLLSVQSEGGSSQGAR